MKTVLAIDTSCTATSVAVAVHGPGDAVVDEHVVGINQHAENLLGIVEKLMTSAGVASLDLVAVGVGPGSFTGLRIGLGTAKGLALGWQIPLVGLSSLAIVAAEAAELHRTPNVLVVSDAKRREVFAGLFHQQDDGTISAVEETLVCKPGDLPANIASWALDNAVAVGTGISKFCLADVLGDRILVAANGDLEPRASYLAKQVLLGAKVESLSHRGPEYIRPSEVEQKFPDGNPGGAFSPRGSDG